MCTLDYKVRAAGYRSLRPEPAVSAESSDQMGAMRLIDNKRYAGPMTDCGNRADVGENSFIRRTRDDNRPRIRMHLDALLHVLRTDAPENLVSRDHRRQEIIDLQIQQFGGMPYGFMTAARGNDLAIPPGDSVDRSKHPERTSAHEVPERLR